MNEISVSQFHLVNAYEDIVCRSVWQAISNDPAMCKCEKCFLDACALVFNKGFTHFVTTERGALLATLPSLSAGSETQLIVAVTQAIEMVKQCPKH